VPTKQFSWVHLVGRKVRQQLLLVLASVQKHSKPETKSSHLAKEEVLGSLGQTSHSREKNARAFCSDQQLPRSMTLDSPTYFVFDNLILYCNNLNYTAALDLHVHLRMRRS